MMMSAGGRDGCRTVRYDTHQICMRLDDSFAKQRNSWSNVDDTTRVPSMVRSTNWCVTNDSNVLRYAVARPACAVEKTTTLFFMPVSNCISAVAPITQINPTFFVPSVRGQSRTHFCGVDTHSGPSCSCWFAQTHGTGR